ncbi:MAG: putative endonuclease [Patescibacteria group bacterium]|nr:putative endonuclease [Patescibacteria group bacterium]
MSTFYTYILACSDGTFYIGKTTDLVRRIRQHNGEIVGGAKYTRGRRPVKLLYSQKFNTLSEALKNEIYLKSLTRNEKEKIITL